MNARDSLELLGTLGIPPDGQTALRISVGLDGLLSRFADETLPYLDSGGCEIRFIEAAYGRGKSHVLRTIEATALRNGCATAYIDCHSRSKPFAAFDETYRQLVRSFRAAPGEDGQAPRLGIGPLLASALENAPHETRKLRMSGIEGDQWLCREFRNLVLAYARTQSRAGTIHGVKEELHDLLVGRPRIGLRLSELAKRNPDLPRPLGRLGKRNAGAWLRSACSLPKSIGFRGLVVLFDETEQSLSLEGLGLRARMIHFANLRNLADYVAIGGLHGCAIYYAVVEDFLPMARRELAALAQRIERLGLQYEGQQLPNPRATWMSLDELTDPGPGKCAFYERLLDRLLDLASEAGACTKDVIVARSLFATKAKDYAERIDPGAVRQYVKDVMSLLK